MEKINVSPRLKVSEGAFTVDGQPQFLIGGEFQYFRIRPELWAGSLAQIAQAGISVISSYIPWIWHEWTEGKFDFTGKTHPGRNLLGFLNELKNQKLLFMARPGPFIYAEYQGFGIPFWVAKNYPETLAVRANGVPDRGTFWNNFSLGHPTYQKLVRHWYSSLFQILSPYWNHPVITLQLDNEIGFLYAASSGTIDFNIDTRYRFSLFLRQKYKAIEKLERAWNKRLGSFSEVSPPRHPFSQPEAMDWQEFLELWTCDFLRNLKQIQNDLAPGIPTTHNEPVLPYSPCLPSQHLKIVDFIGYDIYHKQSAGNHVSDFPFVSSIYPCLLKPYTDIGHPLLALELGLGWPDPRAKIRKETVIHSVVGSLAHGAKGCCFFPVQDGVETSGQVYDFRSILNHQGEPTVHFTVLRKIVECVRKHENEFIYSEGIYDPMAFLTYQPNFRFHAEDYLPFWHYPDPVKYLGAMGTFGFLAVFMTAGYNPQILDLEKTPDHLLQKFKLLFLPNKGFLDEAAHQKCLRYVKNGGTLISFPSAPLQDLNGHYPARQELFPYAVEKSKWFGNFSIIRNLIWDYGVRYLLRDRKKIESLHATSLHIIDLFEPLLSIIRRKLPPVSFLTNVGRKIPGNYFLQQYQAKQEIFLRRKKKAAGYCHPCGKGKSIVLGTLPGGFYMTPHYYQSRAADRKELSLFAHDIAALAGITRRFETDMELEIVIRKSVKRPKSGLIFVLNRLKRQCGNVSFRDLQLAHLETVFASEKSRAVLESTDRIRLDIAADDALVLKYAET
ncbi:MAG TPA: beta-galactosidase [Candidatus Omnitrophota bacterium]|nr:beta-galactosidase [Candidatus Omnitrophota bacterium]